MALHIHCDLYHGRKNLLGPSSKQKDIFGLKQRERWFGFKIYFIFYQHLSYQQVKESRGI